METHSWVSFRKALDDWNEDAARDGIRTPDAQFAGHRIGQKLDFPHALSQISDRHLSVLQQHRAVGCRLDAPAATVEESHAERGFKRRNRIGNCGLGHVQLHGGLRHAAVLDDGQQDMQVAQPHPPADPGIPVRWLFHKEMFMS